jgi:tetratricopeptide (TPR) repeat protein
MRHVHLSGLALLFLGYCLRSVAGDLDQAQEQFQTGDYIGCVDTLRKSLQDQASGEERYLLLSKAEMTVGHYREALKTIKEGLEREPESIRLRWKAREIYQANGQTDSANDIPEEIFRNVSSRPWAYRDPVNIVVFGQAVLARGADPKQVLTKIFDPAKKADPKLVDVYLAGGNLALDKHDFALAAKQFEAALKLFPDEPELHYGLAQAYAPSDTAAMSGAVEAALERNSNHVGSLLLLADHTIDAEDYNEAAELLDRIKAINPWHPDAWAYRAALAHLQNQPHQEEGARETALQFWPTNPRVDYLIGLKLSQNYRFAEGAAHQRQALANELDYLPAKAQLAQDLLRLGDEVKGWRLAQEVQKRDAYDVQAYNLANLHDVMAKFTTLTNRDFLVRMGSHEAAVYGPQVLALLSQAHSNLCTKYSLEPKRPTIVEVFPEQKDFAVRTFGMPGNPGYLGVCFGRVVTANSPAAQHGHPVNWQAVLYHEFCHVVTLQITKNKMPRWLSEGISVYEESQANPAWGQRMNSRYREMVLGDELTPVSKLSGAFLAPKSEMHLQFAYYESSLVVEFLVQRFGLGKLKAILGDLGQGMSINEAIERNVSQTRLNDLLQANSGETNGAMERIDKEFAAFAKERAEKLAPGLDWDKPEFVKDREEGKKRRGRPRGLAMSPEAEDEAWKAWGKSRPTNFWFMMREAERLTVDKKWSEAKPVLTKLVELYPDFAGPDSAYRMLAATCRRLGETNAEREVLGRFAEKDDEAPDAYQRLMELDATNQDWGVVALNARRYLAVNPLVPVPYRFLAQSSEKLGDTQTGIISYRALVEMDPADPAEAHFQLAQLLHRNRNPEARLQVLMALEEAPSYRPALRLLLEVAGESKGDTIPVTEPQNKVPTP